MAWTSNEQERTYILSLGWREVEDRKGAIVREGVVEIRSCPVAHTDLKLLSLLPQTRTAESAHTPAFLPPCTQQCSSAHTTMLFQACVYSYSSSWKRDLPEPKPPSEPHCQWREERRGRKKEHSVPPPTPHTCHRWMPRYADKPSWTSMPTRSHAQPRHRMLAFTPYYPPQTRW